MYLYLYPVLRVSFDSTIFSRVQIMILPLAYLAFLVALSRKKLSAQAETCNAVFLTLVFCAYFFDAKQLKLIELTSPLNPNLFH